MVNETFKSENEILKYRAYKNKEKCQIFKTKCKYMYRENLQNIQINKRLIIRIKGLKEKLKEKADKEKSSSTSLNLIIQTAGVVQDSSEVKF